MNAHTISKMSSARVEKRMPMERVQVYAKWMKVFIFFILRARECVQRVMYVMDFLN